MENQIKPLSITVTLPTKKNVEDIAMTIIDQCNAGEINPAEMAVKLAAIEKVCGLVRDGIKRCVLSEIEKYDKKEDIVILGAKIQQKETGVKYDYSSSEAWNAISEGEKKMIAKRKEIETIAKNVPEGSQIQYTDTDTGETLTIVRAAKSSETNFAVTLGK